MTRKKALPPRHNVWFIGSMTSTRYYPPAFLIRLEAGSGTPACACGCERREGCPGEAGQGKVESQS